jgi:hypothetical protein
VVYSTEQKDNPVKSYAEKVMWGDVINSGSDTFLSEQHKKTPACGE